MFLALYFATEEDERPLACNDNESILLDAGWYSEALRRLAENGKTWNDRHTATLTGEPVG